MKKTRSIPTTRAPDQEPHNVDLVQYQKRQKITNQQRADQSILIVNDAERPSLSTIIRSL